MKETLKKSFFHLLYFFHRGKVIKKPIVLYYHRVIESNKLISPHFLNPNICLERSLFEKQMEYLNNNCHVLSLDEYVEYVEGVREIEPNSVLITFDDGYRDNYLHAFPILQKYSMPATIFLTTGFIGTDKLFWWDLLAEIIHSVNGLHELWEIAENLAWPSPFERRDYKNFKSGAKYYEALNDRLKGMQKKDIEGFMLKLQEMSGKHYLKPERIFLAWDEIREMQNNGITFGSHSHSHTNLRILQKAIIMQEVMISKEIIEQNIGQEITAFSYPFGFFNDASKDAVKEAGYRVGFTTKNSRDSYDIFSIGRIPIKQSRSVGITGDFSSRQFYLEYRGILCRFGELKKQLVRKK